MVAFSHQLLAYKDFINRVSEVSSHPNPSQKPYKIDGFSASVHKIHKGSNSPLLTFCNRWHTRAQ
jgi:hypothetical protein